MRTITTAGTVSSEDLNHHPINIQDDLLKKNLETSRAGLQTPAIPLQSQPARGHWSTSTLGRGTASRTVYGGFNMPSQRALSRAAQRTNASGMSRTTNQTNVTLSLGKLHGGPVIQKLPAKDAFAKSLT